jgi:hypothetical protein
MWKELSMIYLQILSKYFPGATEEITKHYSQAGRCPPYFKIFFVGNDEYHGEYMTGMLVLLVKLKARSAM